MTRLFDKLLYITAPTVIARASVWAIRITLAFIAMIIALALIGFASVTRC